MLKRIRLNDTFDTYCHSLSSLCLSYCSDSKDEPRTVQHSNQPAGWMPNAL